MSDLVGNPEDRFSRVAAHLLKGNRSVRKVLPYDDYGFRSTHCPLFTAYLFEPVHEKTNNLGFRPGPTQTSLYSHRRNPGS